MGSSLQVCWWGSPNREGLDLRPTGGEDAQAVGREVGGGEHFRQKDLRVQRSWGRGRSPTFASPPPSRTCFSIYQSS